MTPQARINCSSWFHLEELMRSSWFIVMLASLISVCAGIGTSPPYFATGTTISSTSPFSITFGNFNAVDSILFCNSQGVSVATLDGAAAVLKAGISLSSCPYVLAGNLGLGRMWNLELIWASTKFRSSDIRYHAGCWYLSVWFDYCRWQRYSWLGRLCSGMISFVMNMLYNIFEFPSEALLIN